MQASHKGFKYTSYRSPWSTEGQKAMKWVLVEMIGVKNIAYCSVLAENAKTWAAPLAAWAALVAWEALAAISGSWLCMIFHRHRNVHTNFGKFCEDWTPTAPITQSILVFHLHKFSPLSHIRVVFSHKKWVMKFSSKLCQSQFIRLQKMDVGCGPYKRLLGSFQ